MAPHNQKKNKRAFDKDTNKKSFDKKNKKKARLRPGEFDLEKARQDVFMLGIKGFTHKDKQEAKRELAIRLGATPKKPRGKNIKKHMEEMREKKLKRQQEILDREKFGREFGGSAKSKKNKPQHKISNKRKRK